MTTTPTTKGKAAPLVRTPAQQKALEKAEAKKREAEEKQALAAAAKANAQQLAQIVNLHISGFSLADIGAEIGMSADQVDRMIASDAARYVKNQPALRTYVRNWISERYAKMIEADWDAASDPGHMQKLEHQDRVDRFLRSMARLHGAEAPTQSEVKVDAAPEAVERMVAALSAQSGVGYDESIFDVVDAEVVHDSAEQSTQALSASGEAVEHFQEGEDSDGF